MKMHITKTLIATLILLAALPSGKAFAQEQQPSPAPVRDDASDPVVEKALAWLGDIDSGRYAQSWRNTSAGFQNAVTETDWEKALKSVRAPLGTLAKRQLQHCQQTSTLPGAPKGDYVVMQFATEFSRKKSAVETVTFSRESDGAWRASGYFIK
ncbi:hypothetical protein OPIT5_27935 [Opitutaceae bacterium TAV5]|nr:hypothetical protein OPIT5_27935 [Opitutaceae bacterium TAV5]